MRVINKDLRQKDVVQKMRPLQQIVYPMIIEDVMRGEPPTSFGDCFARYIDELGEPWYFEVASSWSGDLREEAIKCLIGNGFKKGNAVRVDWETGELSSWVADRPHLECAAELEVIYGGFKKNAAMKDLHYGVIGEGSQAAYVYSDSYFNMHSIKCCKIGKHDSSDVASIINRIMSQYGTGSPGSPVIRLIIAVNDAGCLETKLHRTFSGDRLKSGVGTEWFETSFSEAEKVARELLNC